MLRHHRVPCCTCWFQFSGTFHVSGPYPSPHHRSLRQELYRNGGATTGAAGNGECVAHPPPTPTGAAGHRRRAGLHRRHHREYRGGHRRHGPTARPPAPPTAHPRRPRLAHGMEGSAGHGNDTSGLGRGEACGGGGNDYKWFQGVVPVFPSGWCVLREKRKYRWWQD